MQTTAPSFLLPQTYELSALISLHTCAQRCAAQQSIARGDRADCAQTFILRLVQRDKLRMALSSPLFANRCAMNFARNHRRNRVRLKRHEADWPQQRDEDGHTAEQEFACPRQSAHATMESQHRLCCITTMTWYRCHCLK